MLRKTKSKPGANSLITWLFFSIILSFSTTASAATTISSDITADTTWTLGGSPYIVSSAIEIHAGVTLTINQGVAVQFNNGAELIIRGTLEAVGSTSSQITFTGSSMSPGWWGGIRVIEAGSATLDYCNVRYGTSNISKDGSGALTLKNSDISNSSVSGLSIAYTNSGALSVNGGCFFFDNTTGILLNLNASSDFIDTACTFNANTYDVAVVRSGNLTMTTDVTWALNSAYSLYLGREITVAEGATLTVSPGTVVKFDEAAGINVEGTLLAKGINSGLLIYFTDWRDDAVGGDANGDGNASEPTYPRWRGINVKGTGSATLEHCTVRYGGYSDQWVGGRQDGNLTKTGSGNLSLKNSTISHASNYWGLKITSNSGALSAIGCNFTHNAKGILLDANVSTDFIDTGCIFSDNWIDVETSGIMTVDTTWALNSAYSLKVATNITVAGGVTLTILPGTVIKASTLSVEGTLSAIGTGSRPIYFTDWRDDSVGGDANGDGDATTPVPGGWHGIFIRDGGSAALRYCTVRYGGYGVHDTNIYKTGTGTLSIDDSTISDSDGIGLKLSDTVNVNVSNSTISNCNTYGIYGNQAALTVTGSKISFNTLTGIFFEDPVSGATISSSVFGNNGSYAMYNADPSVCIEARVNYWGHSSGPLDDSSYNDCADLYNPTGSGEQVSDGILYSSWIIHLGPDPKPNNLLLLTLPAILNKSR